MIPTKNFFNVCKTAIMKCRWLGEDAGRVHLALKELEKLEQSSTEARNAVKPTNEYKPEAGDIEYHKDEPEPEIDATDEDFDDEDDTDET